MQERLAHLESSGNYVFHGSSAGGIEQFEPRQAHTFRKPDGTPAIFASEYIKPPVFMAVLGSRKVGGWGKKDLPGFGFYIQQSDWEQAHREHWSGFVYVLDKKDFAHHGAWEWRSDHPVKPLEVYQVTLDDLPQDIAIMGDKAFAEYYDKHR